jgi:hypothetical protein
MRAGLRETHGTRGSRHVDRRRFDAGRLSTVWIVVFSVFVIFDWEIHFSDSTPVHRARSRVRDDEGLGCFMFFILGFVTCSLRRTPRPPAELCPPGLINSIPAFSSAETNFIRESTLPRITPSLASMR